MPKELQYRWEFEIPVPREKLWHYVADLDRIVRIVGRPKVTYQYRANETGGSTVHVHTRMFGMKLDWTEHPTEWVEPEHFKVREEFRKGPFKSMVMSCELHPGGQPGHTRAVNRVTVEPRGILGAIMARLIVGVRMRKGFQRVYRAAEAWAARTGSDSTIRTQPQPSSRLHLLDARLAPIASKHGLNEIGRKIVGWMAHATEDQLVQLRPYRLADSLEEDRHQVLRFFLHATQAGAFDLHWDIICPSCRGSRLSLTALSEVPSTGHCAACNIDFGVDFDRAVEVSFSPAPLGLGTRTEHYCLAGPKTTPHVIAATNVPADGRATLAFEAEPGKYQFDSPQCKGAVYADLTGDAGADSGADLTLTPEGIVGVPERLSATRVTLSLTNRTGAPASVRVARAAWADDLVTAADVTTMQEFRDLFGSQVLAPGIELSVRNMVFLFSDIRESTAMYERIGDASAFALVREHFDVLKPVYSRHNGALVKTIGDAVMVVFRKPLDALVAAFEMHREMRGICHEKTGSCLSLRIGIHQGTCIAMEANGLIDYFGTTVNMAARVQSVGEGNEVTLSQTIADDPEVVDYLQRSGEKPDRHTRELRGLSGRFPIHHLSATQ